MGQDDTKPELPLSECMILIRLDGDLIDMPVSFIGNTIFKNAAFRQGQVRDGFLLEQVGTGEQVTLIAEGGVSHTSCALFQHAVGISADGDGYGTWQDFMAACRDPYFPVVRRAFPERGIQAFLLRYVDVFTSSSLDSLLERVRWEQDDFKPGPILRASHESSVSMGVDWAKGRVRREFILQNKETGTQGTVVLDVLVDLAPCAPMEFLETEDISNFLDTMHMYSKLTLWRLLTSQYREAGGKTLFSQDERQFFSELDQRALKVQP